MRILFVAFGSSIHTARWISQLWDENWDLHLFPVDEYYLHPALKNVTVHSLFKFPGNHIDPSVRQEHLWWPLPRGKERLKILSSRLTGDPLSSASRLASLVKKLQPDIVHSMDIRGGLVTLEAYEKLKGDFPSWIHSSWGSDLYYFGRQPELKNQTRKLMGVCKYLMADCRRELELAPEYGFKGSILGVFSAAGGFNIDYMEQFRQPGPASNRKVIALKGRHGALGGRGMVGLHAIQLCADLLKDYEIVVYLPQGDISGAVEYVRLATDLNIRILPLETSHDEMLRLFGSSRISVALGITDGTPHSMLESMVMGAFPIQSDTADIIGWITNGKNGFAVPAEDPKAVASSICEALSNSNLIDDADNINSNITRERIDVSVVIPKIIDVYKNISMSQNSR